MVFLLVLATALFASAYQIPPNDTLAEHVQTPMRSGLLLDAYPCTSGADCASSRCTQSCCGTSFTLAPTGCERVPYLGGRLLSSTITATTGPLRLPSEGIPFTLVNTRNGGFRFITKVHGVPLLLDTGSSGLIFCNALQVSQAEATALYGCNNYGIVPTPTNLPTLYGAATKFYETPVSTGLSVESLGPTPYVLDQHSLYQVAVSKSKNLNFCVDGVKGIFGLGGDIFNQGCAIYTSFPDCAVTGCRGTVTTLLSAFPQLVGQNDWIFSIYLDYTDKKGQLLLGTSAIDITKKVFSPCTSSPTGNATFEHLGTVGLTGFSHASSLPKQTDFGYYQTKFTSCGVRGQSQVSVSDIPVIWDTGTEVLVFPTRIYSHISASSTWLDCPVNLQGGGSTVLSISVTIDQQVSAAQGIPFAQDGGASTFILGVPVWAQWYTVFDLNAATLALYTPPLGCTTKPNKGRRSLLRR